jgi:predicted AAA+ superfamily ATPase
MGDSLAGRFFPYRLHPLDLWELSQKKINLMKTYQQMKICSGFPEPFLEGSEGYYGRWSKTHLDLILKQDLLDLESVRNIGAMETLISLLQHRIGSTVSARSLAIDLQKDPKTIQNWIKILENLYVIFKVSPFHKNVARSLLKEPKIYLFDLARVRGDEGAILENLVALALRKQLDYLSDVRGISGELYFVRNRDGDEIDFYIHWDRSDKHKPLLIEVKKSDGNISNGYKKIAGYFQKAHQKVQRIQLVLNLDRERHYPSGEKVLSLLDWLSKVPLIENI